MFTADAVHYVTREGNDYSIRFVEKRAPLRNTWFIFEVKNLSKNTVTEQGISVGRQFLKIVEDTEGFSEKSMCELALLRLKIALERKEEDTTANRPRPTLDCGYDLQHRIRGQARLDEDRNQPVSENAQPGAPKHQRAGCGSPTRPSSLRRQSQSASLGPHLTVTPRAGSLRG